MFKYYFEQINNVEIWPIISLSIFFIFFLVLLIWVFKTDKNHIIKMSNMPLEGNNSDNTSLKGSKHEKDN